MKVCISNPPWQETHQRGIRAGSRVPNIIGDYEHTFMPFPFLLAYAAAVLQERGIVTLILDGIAEGMTEEEYLHRVERFNPDLLIVEIGTASYHTDQHLLRRAKERTHATIAVCGPHASALPLEVLQENQSVDVILVGEIEHTLLDLVHALERRQGVEDVDGIVYRVSAKEIGRTPPRALIPDLDQLPYPHRETLPLQKYGIAGYARPTLFMYASRGCPYLCNYCLWPQTMYGAGKYRGRAPQAVLREMKMVYERNGPFASVYFDDDIFNVGKKRMHEFAEALLDRPGKVPWGCNSRPELFDREILRKLADAGLFNIRLGVESGDPEIQRRIQKHLDFESTRRCIEDAHSVGIKVHVFYTVGLSGESWDSVKRTAKFAKTLAPDSVSFTITTPYPGTAYYEEAVREGYLVTRDWGQYNCVSTSVVRTQQLTAEEVARAERYLMRKVYYTPSYIVKRFRYAANTKEIATLARKGLKLLLR